MEPNSESATRTGGSLHPDCYAALVEAAEHHEHMADVRLKNAVLLRTNIERMDADASLRPNFQTPWEQTKAYNLNQATFDEEWGRKHQRFAKAIRTVMPHNND